MAQFIYEEATDLLKLKKVFDDLNIQYKQSNVTNVPIHKKPENEIWEHKTIDKTIEIEIDQGSGNENYVTSFYFGLDGKYLDHSICDYEH